MRYPILTLLIVLATLLAGDARAQDDTAQDARAQAERAAATGAALRKMILQTSAADLEFTADEAFPTVYGLVTEYRIGDHTATIVCLRDGTASLYTSTGFGITGGQAYDFVRDAAIRCVTLAETHAAESEAAPSQPPPAAGMVQFYFLTYDGVRVHRVARAAIDDETSPHTPLFIAATDVLTLLRHITDIQAEHAAAVRAAAAAPAPKEAAPTDAGVDDDDDDDDADDE